MEQTKQKTAQPEHATESQSLGQYMEQRPALLLTFLDIAERYAARGDDVRPSSN